MVLLALLISITLAWTGNISRAQDAKAEIDREQDARSTVIEENLRNIHHEQKIDRGILNRIDKNTGGEGNAPPVRPLRDSPR
jgi:hypothetical protein